MATDGTWEWNPNHPKNTGGPLGAISGDWKQAVIVPAITVWTTAIEGSGKQLLGQSINGNIRMTRTSLMKSDFLMRSLGRPMREQIVSMRPSELTTLEAVDLTNGSTLANYLTIGATHLANRWGDDRSGLITYLNQFALSRMPTPEERRILEAALSPTPTAQQIEDILWVIVMMPEFMLVR